MKKLLLLLALVPTLLWAQNTAVKGFSIKGTIAGLENGEVQVATLQDRQSVASGTAASGSFAVNGAVPEPGLYFLVLPHQQPQFIFLENTPITVTGDAKDIKNLKIEGSSSHRDFQEFKRIFDPLIADLNVLAAGLQKETNEKKREELIGQWNILLSRVDAQVGNFITVHPASHVSTYLLLNFSQISTDPLLLDQRFNSLDATVRTTQMGKMLADRIAVSKIGAIGTDAMDFTQNDVNGKPVALSSFKGKYVLLDFWASWCRPCRAENPNVVKVYNKFKDKNFTILGVSLDQQKEAWVRAIQADHLGWNHVSDLQQWSNAAAQLYRIESIPGNFLIDPNGKIIARDLRGEDLEKKLCQVLGCTN